MAKEVAIAEQQQHATKDIQEQEHQQEETINALLVAEEKATTSTVTTTTTTTTTLSTVAMAATTTSADQPTASRELPIFSNPLLADATQANSVPIKPKTARIKAGSKMINMLKIHAPKVDGEVVIMRRTDTDLVHATAMFKAAYPAVSDRMVTQENKHVLANHQGVAEKLAAIAGVWVSVSEAKNLAREYDIELFMRPLLDAAGERKEASTPELSSKAAASANDEAESVASQEEGTVVADQDVVETTTTTTTSSTTEKVEVVETVAGMKRRIEELEEETVRNKRTIRGLATVAVGLAAASIIPSVLPYFS
ncbi:hypothetical protein DFQ27_001862 [Actinomortierella ambigua]|uniref:HTH APSES-type domain-containing protein n=1 Tax=Actinomortierella ambigua TaxID=1343610 RepID=A0A9P6U830_9FUNG|nr:hypothetical protein DFQ27_001862 [Actinomortierella ambigua]